MKLLEYIRVESVTTKNKELVTMQAVSDSCNAVRPNMCICERFGVSFGSARVRLELVISNLCAHD